MIVRHTSRRFAGRAAYGVPVSGNITRLRSSGHALRRPDRRYDDARQHLVRTNPTRQSGAHDPKARRPDARRRGTDDRHPAGAVEIIPEDDLRRKLERSLRRKSAAHRETGIRPDRARHPSRAHGRPSQAATVPGSRPHGGVPVGDFTGMIGDPERPQRDPQAARPRRSGEQRQDLHRAGVQDPRPREQPWSTTTAAGSRSWNSRMCCGSTATQTVAQMLERDDFEKRYAGGTTHQPARVRVSARAGLRLGGAQRGRRDRRHRAEVQPAHGARDPARTTARSRRSSSPFRSSRASTAWRR